MAAGWYHWKVDDLRAELGVQPAPYLASTSQRPLPRVLAYSPALTLRSSTKEQHNAMLVGLLLVSVCG